MFQLRAVGQEQFLLDSQERLPFCSIQAFNWLDEINHQGPQWGIMWGKSASTSYLPLYHPHRPRFAPGEIGVPHFLRKMDWTTVNQGQGRILRKFTGHTAGESSPRPLSGPLIHAAKQARPRTSFNASWHSGQVSSPECSLIYLDPLYGDWTCMGAPEYVFRHVHHSSVYKPRNPGNIKMPFHRGKVRPWSISTNCVAPLVWERVFACAPEAGVDVEREVLAFTPDHSVWLDFVWVWWTCITSF